VQDERLIWEWVNDPVMLQFAFQTHEPVPWENHRKWFVGTLEGQKRTQYVAETTDGTPAGQARFEPNEGEPVISVYIAEAFRGKGLAPGLIRMATERFCSEKEASTVIAWIKPENVASYRSFLKAGYGEAEMREFAGQPAWWLVWRAGKSIKN
jgi:RimJ/RimL family protein N-acetyltransferase